MSLRTATVLMLAFVGLYPVVTAAVWIAGGLLSRLFDEASEVRAPPGGWPGVTVLVPAYNESAVIGRCVHAALAVDYPELEILVLDDGSTDRTVEAAAGAAGGDPRLEVVRDPLNRGKAHRLNRGFERARHELVLVTDADTHIHPRAVKLLVGRISRSRRIAAVAGAPHVTNRQNVLCAMQILEAASIIGLIRRTQSLAGRVSVVAGVLGLFRREAVRCVGGYVGRMATEDIDLSWRLLQGGWHTAFEPDALVGMEVPAAPRALWAQRLRWARGQGEVLHVHLRDIAHWRQRRMWPLALEALASLVWVIAFALTSALVIVDVLTVGGIPFVDLTLSWGIAVAVVATLQLAFAMRLDFHHDRLALFAFLLAPLFTIAYWAIAAAAAIRSEAPALVQGPPERHVVWDVPREAVPEAAVPGKAAVPEAAVPEAPPGPEPVGAGMAPHASPAMAPPVGHP